MNVMTTRFGALAAEIHRASCNVVVVRALNVLEFFDSIVAAHLQAFNEVGKVRYARSPETALEQRRSLGIQTESADFEILLWESGQVEFGYGGVENPREEHLDISSTTELEELVRRFLEVARTCES